VSGKEWRWLLRNSVESYPLRDKIVLVMNDMAGVEQTVAMGAVKCPKSL